MKSSAAKCELQLDPLREKPDGDTAPAAEVGWYLQRERETLGHSLVDVAKELRVDPQFLFALEQGELHHQLGWTYVLSYVRSYSDYLGFEPGPVVLHYKKILAEDTDVPSSSTTDQGWPFSEVRARAAIATFAGVVGLMGLAGLVFDADTSNAENKEPVNKASDLFERSEHKNTSELSIPALRESQGNQITRRTRDDIQEVTIREVPLAGDTSRRDKSRMVQKRLHELSLARLAVVTEN